MSADARVSAGAAQQVELQQTGTYQNNTNPWVGTQQIGGWFANSLRSTLGLPSVAGSGPAGRGIGVALIDSGINPSADFENRIRAFYDFTRGGIPTVPFDDYGHGTHVAGLIGSNGVLSGFTLQGIAPQVSFVGLKVLDANGQGVTSDVLRAIEYVVANRRRLNVQIVNLSLGHPIFARADDDPLVQAVQQASAAGLVVVTSAGNCGQNPTSGKIGFGGVTSPGNAPSAITVGAVMTQDTVAREDDRVAPYSSRGPTWFDGFVKPDVVAPGNKLTSDAVSSSTLYRLLPTSRRRIGAGQPFLQLSGTSMAAAVTTGVVALVLEANLNARYSDASTLTPNAVKAILQYSAVPVNDDAGAAYDVLTQGVGGINANGAIALGSAIDSSARRGDWWLRNSVPKQTTIGGRAYTWAQNIVWGDCIVWGDLLFHNLQAWSMPFVWGENVVWSDASFTALAQVRAANIVWADSALWATNVVWGDRLIGMFNGDEIVWGSDYEADNIVWGSLFCKDNIVWGNLLDDNIVWGNLLNDSVIGGYDNIVWGNRPPDDSIGGIF